MLEPFFLFVLGALLGSYANVVIWRLPRGESTIKPRSHCPSCNKLIRWFDNIPVVSWLLLRGRCRNCKVQISVRYLLVELLMGSLFAAVFIRYGYQWLTLEYLIMSFGLVTVTFIDFDHMILPDEFTLSGIVLGLLGAALNPEREFMTSLTGVLMGGGFLWAVAYFYFLFRKQEGMGGGDIKLLAWIGAYLGWQSVPFVILSASLIGSVVGLIYAARTKSGLKASIPFGPYIALGAFIYIFGGDQLAQWYLSLFFSGPMTSN